MSPDRVGHFFHATRRRGHSEWRGIRFLAVLGLLMFGAGLLLVPILSQLQRHQGRREQASLESTFAEEVQRRGGRVVVAPAASWKELPTLIAVDLSGAEIDSDLIRRLSDFTSIERLTIDGAELTSDDYRTLGRLSNLRRLSLAGSNVQDEHLPLATTQLTALTLCDTSVTDAVLPRLATHSSLASLDIAGTSVTADGLNALSQFASLHTLELDETCVTPDGIAAMQAVPSLGIMRIRVADGWGRQARDSVNPLTSTLSVRGVDRTGLVLWDAAQPWEETLAGVVEIVVDEVDLDPQQVIRLIEAIGQSEMARPPTQDRSNTNQYVNSGKDIESTDEFLRQLQSAKYHTDEIRVFARDHFTENDLSQLLDALHANPTLQESDLLLHYGTRLLVRHGMDNREAKLQLDRMLGHQDATVRSVTVYAFGVPHDDKDWAPGNQAAEYGVPRIMQLSTDSATQVRFAVAEVLGDLAHLHPKHAPTVMPLLVKMLENKDWHYVNYAIKKVAEASPGTALAHVPELRRLLDTIDFQLPPGQLEETVQDNRRPVFEALCDVACYDPELAAEVAASYVHIALEAGFGGSLTALVAPENSAAISTLVHELLEIVARDPDNSRAAAGGLASIARAIRDMRVP